MNKNYDLMDEKHKNVHRNLKYFENVLSFVSAAVVVFKFMHFLH